MSSLHERIAELSPEKRELLLQKLNQKKGNVSPTKIKPQSRDSQTFPLSFAQQRLWFFNQLEPDSYAYNIPTAVSLTGKLDVAALKSSIKEIGRRHEALRTTFKIVDGEPVQVIGEAVDFQLPVIDLQALSAVAQQEETLRLATVEAETPFDLVNGPLLRVVLVRLGDTENVVLLTMHHIISDGWSTGILIQELTILYTAFSGGTPYTLPKLPIQYADFAVWQRQWLQKEVLQAQITYWKQQLGGELPVLALPSDRPRPAIQSDRGATQSLQLSQSLSEELKALSQQEGSTLFMTLLAAFKVLLHRYTQRDDILIGTPIANRNRSEVEGLIGFFVNTLVLRTNLEGNPSFRQLLRRVREVTLGGYAHQDLPFEQLVEELQPERDLSHNSLFQVMFILQNAPMGVLQLPELTLKALQVESTTANFDLTLSMVETEQGLRGFLEYNTDLFDAATITRMLGHFQTLLAGVVASFDTRLSDLPIFSAVELQQILVSWNRKQSGFLSPLHCIHNLFEAQVEETPDAVAVVFAKQRLTYQQLNSKANQLAHYLRSRGVGKEVLVGICLERTLDLIVGLMAILKAGGAYLPLDPAYPQERLAYMLADAQVSVLLTQERLLADLPNHNAQVICIDSNWELIASQTQENLVCDVTANNLAYIIYTSGSTGQSKGVMVEHRHLVNAYLAWEQAYQLRDRATCHLQMASFCFDVFVGDLVRALCSGGKLVLCPRELLLEPQALYQLMLQEKVDCAEFVPGVLRNLMQYLEESQQRLDFMQLLVCGSDSWYVQEYQKLHRLCGSNTRLINSFGLTEATIDSSYFESETADLHVEQLVPIGRPFANTQIYILDRYLQPVPIGAIAEIYIGGAGLARGYLNRPDLTALKFIPNLFSAQPGACLYKTGDLGRYLHDGNIELLGRTDYQVKLRGFRIELGEIEAMLGQHPKVRESVVIVREDTPNHQYLVAYIVPNDRTQNNLTSTELCCFLQQRLPNYMMPSAFLLLNSLPLTPNGKIDRRALPKPEANLLASEATFVAPASEIEKTLAKIWTEVLSIEIVNIHSNFFELGGHSLLTTRLILKIREAFQVELPLRILFESPTISTLAATLDKTLQPELSTTHTRETIADIQADAILDAHIFPENLIESTTEPANMLLTGATGFVGAFLLNELLQQTPANIYCLVRASNIAEGQKKLQKTLESYLIWHESFLNRIIPILGDLSQPLFGLTDKQFQDLAHKIDVIYHNGAWVHHIYPYSVLKKCNVLGTQQVIKLACRIKTKPIHFISTSSIFSISSASETQVIKEEDSIDDIPLPDNGYVQTKWVGEKLVKAASQRGVPVCIYRLGRVSGHSETGVFNINDFIYRLIIGCIQLGSAPDQDITEDIIPVDYISKAIAHLSRQKTSPGKAFHLVNSQLLHSDILLKVIHSFGYSVPQIPYEQWQTKLMKIASLNPQHPLYPLIPFFPPREPTEQTSTSQTLSFDCQNTLNGLAKTSITCPPIDEKLLNTYLSYLNKNSFLETSPLPL
ncbi:MAG: amino acid adenylation domain-containing protein [Desmonostoc vinosum HA7617-LM4]|jgi:amino acid adenylation domain-containing protein/thioester reductase-like protein|nr:amino acid adenylation domain-containing protein [Desmonostoc vinosum HA7617-LM4]